MNRSFIFTGTLISLAFLGLFALKADIFALTIPLFVYLATGLLMKPQNMVLTVNRFVENSRVLDDTIISVRIAVSNQGPALSEVLIRDETPQSLEIVEGSKTLFTALDSGATAEFTYAVKARRGYYQFKNVSIESYNGLSLFKTKKTLEAETRIMVYPQISKIGQIAIKPRHTKVYAGQIPANTGGTGNEFYGVREYRTADPLRTVNWKATARHSHKVFTNEFEQERIVDVGLILDARWQLYQSTGDRLFFEHSVHAAAAVAEMFLNNGNRVGLFIYGQYCDWTYPGYGRVQNERILQALIRAELGSSQVFDRLIHIPTSQFPSRSQIVFISPLRKDDLETLVLFRACRYQVMVISPDPISFEAKQVPAHRDFETGKRIMRLKRNLLLSRLQEAGIFVLDWNTDLSLYQMINASWNRRVLKIFGQ